ncbi:hypothetical protein GDO86_004835 [Hymenochirus boettgeri]|uniref:exo-alpha-sialidase n=1 Tax=Hymenochirus boettgeri TaxID=247094 RepID=A0A8T2KA79_9PIPI|nr:hypothetical protein GDO86_004835 [Hymenochirus boettgeri]
MEDPSSTNTVTLFHQEPSGVTYRIPGLLYVQQPPTFLAFAEKRSSPCDHDALYLVMRRGVEEQGHLKWQDTMELTSAKMPGHRTMNPCPVYDEKSGTVFLFFICVRTNCSEMWQILTGKNAARLCYITSKDRGKTWEGLKDLTEEIFRGDLKHCATLAVGPGHGIQTSSGRLILPAYLYYIHSRVCCVPVPWKTLPHSFIIYSNDHGESWHKGDMLNQNTGECEVAEVASKNVSRLLYCSARTQNHYRVEAISMDQGVNFVNSHYCRDLCEPPHGCQGSVVCYEPLEESREVSNEEQSLIGQSPASWLVYSHPTSSKSRVNLGIYVNKSPLVSPCWSRPWIISEGPSGYSDLAVCQDSHSFGCLFECGFNACEKINFRRFEHKELIRNLPMS